MAFVGKAEYSKLKNYLELVIDLNDLTESTMVDWLLCKWIFDDKTGNFYCIGKPSSISSVDASKLPDFLYITFHSKEWEKKKEKIQPSKFELMVFDLIKPWLESSETLSGKLMLSPGMALNEQMVKSFVGLKPAISDTIKLPDIEISSYSGNNSQKSYGLSPDQKVSFLLKQLKIDDVSSTLIDCALVIDGLPENKATLIELIKAIL